MRTSLRLLLVLTIGLVLSAATLRAEFLFMSSGNGINTYLINQDGTLTLISGPSAVYGSIAVDIFGRFLYALGDNTVSAFKINSTGAVSLIATSPTGINPSSVAVDVLGRFVYVANAGPFKYPEVPSNVSAYRIGFNGALTPVSGSPFPAGIFPLAVAVDTFGRFVYVANYGTQALADETISGYWIAGDGALIPLPGSPYPNGEGPQSIAIDPFGRFTYTANFYDQVFSAYRIERGGILQQLPGSPYPVDSSSNIVVADPFGRFVYIANYFNRVSAYRVGFNQMTEVPGSPFFLGPTSYYIKAMAIDFSGRFVYVAEYNFVSRQDEVSTYRIGANGALALVPGTTIAAEADAMAVCP